MQASGWQRELGVRSPSYEELKCPSAGGWLGWLQEVWNSHRVKCSSRRRRNTRLMCAVSWTNFSNVPSNRKKEAEACRVSVYKTLQEKCAGL